MPEFDLSIIIVSYNVCSLIVECIESIYKFSENQRIQIIVSDNASTDDTIKTLEKRYPEIYILKNERNLGFSIANNRALNYCQSRFILFLNPDIILIEPVFQKMIDFLEQHQDAGLVGCKLINPDGSIQKSYFESFPTLTNRFVDAIYLEKLFTKYHSKVNSANGFRKVAAIAGACIFTRKKLIEDIGGFDNLFFMYCEDVDLSYRVTQKGYNIYYLDYVSMFHHLGATGKLLKNNYFEKVLTRESVYRYFKKHQGRIKAAFYRLLMIIAGIIRIIVLLTVVPLVKLLSISYDFNLHQSILSYVKVVSWGLGLEKWTKNPG